MRPIQVIAFVISLFVILPAWADGDESSTEPSPEVTRKVMGDDIPDFRSVWGLQSLSDEQRDQVKGILTNFEEDTKPMREELSSIKDAALRGGSLSPEQMQEASQHILNGTMPNTSPAESRVLSRVQELREQVKEKRSETWQQLKNVLTNDQVNEVQNF